MRTGRLLIVMSVVVAMAGVASATRNLIENGSFEEAFTNTVLNKIYDGSSGSFAYAGTNGVVTVPSYCPGWTGEANWGYVWNPAGTGGTNHWGDYVGLTNVSDGVGAYGAWGASHNFRTWQNTGIDAEEGDTIIFSWDMNFLSADIGSSAWFTASLQFVGTAAVVADFPDNNAPYDVWRTHSITQVVNAAQAGKVIQVQIQGKGVWVDNVSVEIHRDYSDGNLLANESFERAFTDGPHTVDPAVDGSWAYGSKNSSAIYLPGWNGEQQWGYALNPDGGSVHFGNNPPAASDGEIVYGAGNLLHYFGVWQNITYEGGPAADGTKSYKLTFDAYQSSTITGVPWLVAKIQMPSGVGGSMTASLGAIGTPSGLPTDSWQAVELTMSANAAFDGSEIQVFLQGRGGTWIDNVRLEIIEMSFESWVVDYGLFGSNALSSTDYDLDGMDNLLEYAFGGNPTNSDAAVMLPTQTISDGATWEYVYRRRVDAATRGLNYDLLLATNGLAGSWNSVSNAYETGSGEIDEDFESVTNEIPIAGQDSGFIELKITE